MAIARKIDPAALARSFADEVSAIPEVKRVWYWSKMGHHASGVLSLDLYVLLSRSDDKIEDTVTQAMMRLNERFSPMMLAVNSFTEDQVREYGVEDELREGTIEISTRGARL